MDGEGRTHMVRWLERQAGEHPYRFGIVFLIIYLGWFVTLEVVDLPVVWHIECWIDDYIPFTKYAVIPYCCWFLWLAESLLHMAGRETAEIRWRTWAPMFSGMLLCLLFCTLVPNSIDLRPDEIHGNDPCAVIARLIQTVDDPKSVCPSLHVYTCVMMDLGAHRAQGYQHAWVKPLTRALDIFICVGTMLLKQHSIVDVVVALAMALIMDAAAERAICGRWPWTKRTADAGMKTTQLPVQNARPEA